MRQLAVILIFLASVPALHVHAAEPASVRDYHSANTLLAKQKYQDALAIYRKVLAAPPAGVNTGEVHARIGDALFRLGDFRSALASYRSALLDPASPDRVQAQYWVGFCCFLLGRDAESVSELLKVPQLAPDGSPWTATAYYWAGRASERMGRKDQAAEYFRKASGGNGKSTQGKFAMKKAEAAKNKQ